jgi:hypothetical protein
MSGFLWDLSPRPLRLMARESQSLCRAGGICLESRLPREMIALAPLAVETPLDQVGQLGC